MADILTILQEPDFKKVVEILCVDTQSNRNPLEYLDEYNGKRERREGSVDNREDKQVDIYSDKETEINEDGDEVPKKTGTETVVVAKIHTNYPKKIVRTAVAFMFGGDMSITADEENDGVKYFEKVFSKGLKMKSVLKKFARTVFVETKAALLFYPREVILPSGKASELRVRLLSIKNGEIYPHFDDYGDMDAFIRKYVATVAEDEGKEHDHVQIYTADSIITAIDMGGSWVQTMEKNLFGKIPVVYAEVEEPEWEDIVTALDRIEMRLSRLSDTNDYFSEPILKSYGATNLPSKKTVGKQIEFEMNTDDDGNVTHGDADYLTWQQTIEAIKLELDMLKAEILGGTSTPDLTFDNVKGIGSVTGVAMKLMFLDAFLKAADNMEVFEPAVARCVSVIKAGICNITNIVYSSQLLENDIDVSFGTVLPDDLREEMEILSIANGGKPINARKTVTARSRFTKDVDEELKQMQDEDKTDAENNGLLGMTFNQGNKEE